MFSFEEEKTKGKTMVLLIASCLCLNSVSKENNTSDLQCGKESFCILRVIYEFKWQAGLLKSLLNRKSPHQIGWTVLLQW